MYSDAFKHHEDTEACTHPSATLQQLRGCLCESVDCGRQRGQNCFPRREMTAWKGMAMRTSLSEILAYGPSGSVSDHLT